jgi:tetratricopeptide (TPR) repeat protein
MLRLVPTSLLCLFAFAGSVVATAAHAEEPRNVPSTVFLTAREPEAPGPAGGIPALGMREVVRQAFLLAARDELGLATRDSILREDFPEKPDEQSVPFELFCRTLDPADDRKLEYVLTRQGAPQKPLWQLKFTVDDFPPLVSITVKAEVWSRKELKDVLLKAGYNGHVPAARLSSEVPNAAYDLLWTWNEISVMAGVRRLHAEIREKGESRDLLSALAIGYANLGSLTDYHNSAAHKVYYARAMLYQERLSKQTNDTPWSLFTSAYVAAQLGMPDAASIWIDQAKKKMAAGSDRPLPWFADVLDKFAHGDLRAMTKSVGSSRERDLARYLNLQAVRFGELDDLIIKASLDLLKDCPDCPRVYNILALSGSLGPMRQGAYGAFNVTGKFLRKRLPDVPGLPESARKLLSGAEEHPEKEVEIEFRKDLVAALKRAGAPKSDTGEPSLSALGHMIDDINFAQALRRLGFEGDDLPSSASLCAAHPYGAYVDAFTYKKAEMEPAARALQKKIDLTQVTFNDSNMLQTIYAMGPTPQLHSWHQVPGYHCDAILADQMRSIKAGWFGTPDDPKVNAENMAYCWSICSKLPIAIATRINRDWQHAAKEMEGYEKTHADDPLVTKALTDRYCKLKRYDDAERCAKLLVKADPDYPSFRLLASVYRATKDHAHWKETLDQAIQLPASGLERAQVQNEIALELLDRFEFQEAVTYADAAAETGAAWTLMTAARCHEMLGEWKKSEQFVQTVSENYEGSRFSWMYWCHRTGRGDVRRADELARKQLEGWGTTLFAAQYRNIAFYYLATGEPDKALLLLQKTYENGHEYYAGLHGAIVADSLGKSDERDALLKQVIETKLPHNFVESKGGEVYSPLAAQFREALASNGDKPLDLAKVDEIQSKSHLPASVLRYFVGVFLKNRGDLPNATKYLTRCAQSTDWNQVEHVLACQLLREMKVQVPPVEEGAKSKTPAPDSAKSKSNGS